MPSVILRASSALACLAVALFWVQAAAAEESQCIKCHTSSGKLIKITRGLDKYKAKPAESKSKGPG